MPPCQRQRIPPDRRKSCVEHANNRWQNIANWSIIALVVAVSSAYALTILFPEWFGSGTGGGA